MGLQGSITVHNLKSEKTNSGKASTDNKLALKQMENLEHFIKFLKSEKGLEMEDIRRKKMAELPKMRKTGDNCIICFSILYKALNSEKIEENIDQRDLDRYRKIAVEHYLVAKYQPERLYGQEPKILSKIKLENKFRIPKNKRPDYKEKNYDSEEEEDERKIK